MLIKYFALKGLLAQVGRSDVLSFYQDYELCQSRTLFMREYIWIICRSGSDEHEARHMEKTVHKSLGQRCCHESLFDNPKKRDCINSYLTKCDGAFESFIRASNDTERLAALKSLDYVEEGDIFLFARNLGMHGIYMETEDIKHIARKLNTDPRELVEKLSRTSGDCAAAVELTLLEADKLGLVDVVLNEAVADSWDEASPIGIEPVVTQA